MMSYTDAENGKVALMQEILGVKDIQDIDLLYELHQEFMDAQKNAGTGNSEGQSELSGFPAGKVHEFDYSDYPAPAQMMLLCKARRSNRAFTAQSVPEELLQQILEAAHRAPTASNAQQIGFTVVTDPVRLREITGFTLGVFKNALKKMQNPLLTPLVKWLMPDAFRYIPVFERLLREDTKGNDLILRKAKAVVFIHAPRTSRFGYQDKKGTLEKKLGIDGKIYAGMALGMPAFRYKNYIDRKDLKVNRL